MSYKCFSCWLNCFTSQRCLLESVGDLNRPCSKLYPCFWDVWDVCMSLVEGLFCFCFSLAVENCLCVTNLQTYKQKDEHSLLRLKWIFNGNIEIYLLFKLISPQRRRVTSHLGASHLFWHLWCQLHLMKYNPLKPKPFCYLAFYQTYPCQKNC